MRVEPKNVNVLTAVFFLLVTHATISSREIEMERLFKADFTGFKPPEATVIKQGAVQRAISEVNFDEVWNAVLVVAMQRNVIVSASKETGVIVCMEIPAGAGLLISGFPTAIVVERKGPRETAVFCNWPDEFYKWADGKPGQRIRVKSFTKQRLGQGFLDRVANQSLVKQRWRYLRR